MNGSITKLPKWFILDFISFDHNIFFIVTKKGTKGAVKKKDKAKVGKTSKEWGERMRGRCSLNQKLQIGNSQLVW